MAAKSYTQWSTFKKCGAQYKFQYVDKIPRPQKAEAAQRGTDIHAVVESIIKGEASSFPAEFSKFEHYEDFFKMLGDKGAIAELPFHLDQEWKTTDQKDKVYVRGFIDIIVPPKDGQIYIYELKTGREYDDHVEQRHFYGTVSLVLYPEAEKVTVIGTYMDLGEYRQNVYTSSMMRTYRYVWDNRMKQLEMPEAMIPNPGMHCRWCPYSADKGGPCKFSGD